MRDQKFKLGQEVCVVQGKIFEGRWFRAKDCFKLEEGKIIGVNYNPGLVDMNGNPTPLRYTIISKDGSHLLNRDMEEFGRGQFLEAELHASKKEAVQEMVGYVNSKIEELEEVKEELLNTIEEEIEERQPLLDDSLFDLSDEDG